MRYLQLLDRDQERGLVGVRAADDGRTANGVERIEEGLHLALVVIEETGTTDADYGAAALSDQGADKESYRLVSIDAVGAPEGCTGGDWHIYRIAQGENDITGYRRGNLERVRIDVETIVTALNGRRQWTKRKALSMDERRAATAARRADVK